MLTSVKKKLTTVIPKQNASMMMEVLPASVIQGMMVMEPPVSVSSSIEYLIFISMN